MKKVVAKESESLVSEVDQKIINALRNERSSAILHTPDGNMYTYDLSQFVDANPVPTYSAKAPTLDETISKTPLQRKTRYASYNPPDWNDDDGPSEEEQEERDREHEDSYKKFTTRVQNLYQKFVDSKNNLYLYKLIVSYFSRHLSNAIMYNPEKPRVDMNTRIQKDVSNLVREMLESEIDLAPHCGKIIEDFIKGIYLDSYYDKSIHVSVYSSKMCSELINKAVSKGVIIDEEFAEVIKSVKFGEAFYDEDALELCYVHSINALFCITVHDHSEHGIFDALSRIHHSLDKLPDDVKKSDADEEMIEIDGKKYIRRIFEAIVESNYDSFMGNLELETILDSKDTDAEEPVGEFKLL